jgi:hypothetical protein
MAEGTIKKITDKGFGFIDTGKGKDLFFTCLRSVVLGLKICTKDSAFHSRKVAVPRDRTPRMSLL